MSIRATQTYICDHCGTELNLLEPAATTPGVSHWQTLRQSHMGGSTEWLLCPASWSWFLEQMQSRNEFRN